MPTGLGATASFPADNPAYSSLSNDGLLNRSMQIDAQGTNIQYRIPVNCHTIQVICVTSDPMYLQCHPFCPP